MAISLCKQVVFLCSTSIITVPSFSCPRPRVQLAPHEAPLLRFNSECVPDFTYPRFNDLLATPIWVN